MLGLVFDRWDESDRGVQAVFVEPVEPVQGGELEVIDDAERAVAADAAKRSYTDIGFVLASPELTIAALRSIASTALG